MFEFNDETKWILGRPNFTCIGIAELLRKGGKEIGHKAEDEQAAVIYFYLGMYEKHGDNWREEASNELRRMAETVTNEE